MGKAPVSPSRQECMVFFLQRNNKEILNQLKATENTDCVYLFCLSDHLENKGPKALSTFLIKGRFRGYSQKDASFRCEFPWLIQIW